MPAYYSKLATMAFAMFAASYGAVPLYRIYCNVTGKGGKAVKENEDKVLSLKKNEDRIITVRFNADTSSRMAWQFEPVQGQVKIHPGETTLAFYRARNPLDKPVIGVATYSVMPYEAGLYFNKIQCFCFEEQMLNANEDVFMPVLFYIDPKFTDDPRLETTDEVVLSYTFFQSKDGGLFMPKLGTDSDGGILNTQ